MTEQEILALYYDTAPAEVKKLTLSRGGDDFREVYLVDDGTTKLAIKHTSNAFTDAHRLEVYAKLIDAYNALGIYCPRYVPTKHGNLFVSYPREERDCFVYAEAFSRYETAEFYENRGLTLCAPNSLPFYARDVLHAVGTVASAHLDCMDFASAYCLLEPFCPPDTTDEQEENTLHFLAYLEEHWPELAVETAELREIFYANQRALAALYPLLPTSCFQADLNISNILFDETYHFAGLIDFNLAGREPCLNYLCREALWMANWCLPEEIDTPYDAPELEETRIALFREALGYLAETYRFSALERAVFPILFRYINGIWWRENNALRAIHEDKDAVRRLLAYIKRQMTRDDVRLPE